MGLTGAIFLARWVSIQVCRWTWRGLGESDREKILWMLPRGLITIVLAIEIVEVRGQSMAFLPPMSFAVILLTNLILVFGSIRTSKMASPELPEPAEPARESEHRRHSSESAFVIASVDLQASLVKRASKLASRPANWLIAMLDLQLDFRKFACKIIIWCAVLQKTE